MQDQKLKVNVFAPSSTLISNAYLSSAKLPPAEEVDKSWVIVEESIGQFGSQRSSICKGLTKQYGYLCWRLAWKVEDGRCIPFDEAIKYYEEAYLGHLNDERDKLEYLVSKASDVYDTSRKNLQSGTDYHLQESKSNHYQDIAIRRAIARMGLSFAGDKLIQIRSRSRDKTGRSLSPGRIPFHKPELITNPIRGWWNPGSLEEFWQSNKCIQFNPILPKIHPKYRKQYFPSKS